MPIPEQLGVNLKLPVIVAPMFLASGPQLVIESSRAGIVGSFPSLNQRTCEGFEEWLIIITESLKKYEKVSGMKAAPFAVNLIAHKSNPRLQDDLALCVKYKVPLIITSLGTINKLVEQVHAYGGIVFHDVTNNRHARKAAEAGVDGLIAVSAGAGGHAGTLNPFVLISEIRRFFNKTIILAGCISNGRDIAAAQLMGADMVYIGTRFINTNESLVEYAYKQMIVNADATDIVYTPSISGLYGNFLRPSIEQAGLDPENRTPNKQIDYGANSSTSIDRRGRKKTKKAWKDIWSAGQGVGSINDIIPVSELIVNLADGYHSAISEFCRLYQQKFCSCK